jgi:hypothetical protein
VTLLLALTSHLPALHCLHLLIFTLATFLLQHVKRCSFYNCTCPIWPAFSLLSLPTIFYIVQSSFIFLTTSLLCLPSILSFHLPQHPFAVLCVPCRLPATSALATSLLHMAYPCCTCHFPAHCYNGHPTGHSCTCHLPAALAISLLTATLAILATPALATSLLRLPPPCCACHLPALCYTGHPTTLPATAALVISLLTATLAILPSYWLLVHLSSPCFTCYLPVNCYTGHPTGPLLHLPPPCFTCYLPAHCYTGYPTGHCCTCKITAVLATSLLHIPCLGCPYHGCAVITLFHMTSFLPGGLSAALSISTLPSHCCTCHLPLANAGFLRRCYDSVVLSFSFIMSSQFVLSLTFSLPSQFALAISLLHLPSLGCCCTCYLSAAIAISRLQLPYLCCT